MAKKKPNRHYVPRHWPLERKLAHMSKLDPSSGCRLWQAGVDDWGYGLLRFQGKMLRAHCAAWELHNRRPVPEGKLICHHCDTPRCIEGTHLFDGTNAGNKADSVAKRRHAIGSRNRHAKITDEIAREIFLAKGTQNEVGARYGISGPVVCQIRNKKAWRHIHDQ